MALSPEDITFYQSIETESLGGAISAVIVPTGLNLYFNDVDIDEATAGSTAYRCFYIKNDSAIDTFSDGEIYISVLTDSPSTHCELGLDIDAGLNGVAQIISDEGVPPTNVTFSAYTEGAPLLFGVPMAPGEFYPVWIKRVTAPNAVGAVNDSAVLAARGVG